MTNTSLVEISASEQRLAARVDQAVTNQLALSGASGGLGFRNAAEAMEFAKLMAISSVAVPKHLRGNPGACLAVTIQAIEWRLSPYAVANKSYSVNDRLAYESQLIQAVILQRAPIKGRFKVEYSGVGEHRVCKVSATLQDGGAVEYESPEFGRITPKNSPLWKSDPDQQQFYYSGRALCRRHFPDVLLGIYDRDEIDEAPRDPGRARDVTPAPRTLADKFDALAQPAATTEPAENAGAATTEDADGLIEDAGLAPQNEPEAAAGADTAPAAPTSPPEGEVEPVPTTAAEYEACADRWIAAATDDTKAAARWRQEKDLRTKLGVPVDVAKRLKDALQERIDTIRYGDGEG